MNLDFSEIVGSFSKAESFSKSLLQSIIIDCGSGRLQLLPSIITFNNSYNQLLQSITFTINYYSQ